jgi:HAD superfamily hydrolase (TIGR01509 family)
MPGFERDNAATDTANDALGSTLAKLPQRVEAIAFDMDGLLVDSECLYRDTMIEVAGLMGHTLTPETFLTMIGTAHDAYVEIQRQTFGEAFDVAGFDDEVERRVRAVAAPLKEGVLELLGFAEALKLPCALVTNNSRDTVERVLAAHDLIDRFNVVIAGGDAAHGKPHPAPYLLAAERMAVAPAACLALEDSFNGVRAARSAGMMTVMVPDLLAPTDEMWRLCAHIATTLHDVRTLLGQTV